MFTKLILIIMQYVQIIEIQLKKKTIKVVRKDSSEINI